MEEVILMWKSFPPTTNWLSIYYNTQIRVPNVALPNQDPSTLLYVEGSICKVQDSLEVDSKPKIIAPKTPLQFHRLHYEQHHQRLFLQLGCSLRFL